MHSIFGGLLLLPLVLPLVACSGGSPSPQPSPSPSPASAHLYASSSQGGSGQILLFPLPLTSNSSPSLTANNAASTVFAVDANGNVATLDSQCHLTIYNAPLTGSLTPSATFNNGTNCTANKLVGLAFSPSGDLFVTTGGSQINVFTHPFSSSSTVSQVITTPDSGINPRNLAVDASGNLYVAAVGNNITFLCSFIVNFGYVFAPPYTSAPASTGAICGDFAFSSIAVGAGQLFVSADNGTVLGFNLPIGSAGTFSFATSLNRGAALAVDHNGNLYVSDGQIKVFTPPVSSSSIPSLTLNVNAADIAIGP